MHPADSQQSIVGRDDELQTVQQFLAGAIPSGVLLIEGQAGIGKTAMWSWAVETAERRSYRVVRARPNRLEADVSYAVLTDLIGEAFTEVRALLPGPQQRALSTILLRESSDAPATQRTTATGLASILQLVADDRPLLLAVDDTQWMDQASAWALSYAIRRLPANCRILLSRRTRDDSGWSSEARPGISLEVPVELVSLGPLTDSAVHHLINRRHGSPIPRPDLRRISQLAGGNPFLAVESASAFFAAADDQSLICESRPLPRCVIWSPPGSAIFPNTHKSWRRWLPCSRDRPWRLFARHGRGMTMCECRWPNSRMRVSWWSAAVSHGWSTH